MRDKNMPLVPPARDLAASLNAEERARLDQVLPFAIGGSRETVYRKIESLLSATVADELMILSFTYDEADLRRCAEIVADMSSAFDRTPNRSNSVRRYPEA